MKRVLILILAICVTGLFFTGCGVSGSRTEESEDKEAYLIFVVDENSAPVAGVSVQLCSGSTCILQKTDDTGIAEFNVEEGRYTAHLLAVPDGFEEDSREYEVPETYGLITIVLNAAKSK